ncbi:broad-complex core-protein, putative [Pediculus humanus corporis]|uniref:Broad-complex core-protein, putative n=1 Tax=Pediculus humanus subsp. corporis TaxID=121224 RepID=E0VB71_PEDHC|nr:broad-complex core-protein, putative [Pediculus humanus corporis]EEB10627.1 broad-complex core-protein, putative [Pediculus humanus corporis]
MSQFETLKEDEDFVDVTLSCYGQSIKAHKVVLSACSPYLKSIFKEHPCKHPVIILDNLSYKNLEAVIQFVYTGQVYVEQTDLPSFLKAAEALQIRGLSNLTNSTENFIEVIILCHIDFAI